MWKPIKYNRRYSINKNGGLRNNNTGRILKPGVQSLGYHAYFISSKMGNKWQYAHRLVAEAFIPNPKKKGEVNHKDGVKSNNNVKNLEWVTHSENIQYSHDKGWIKKIKGRRHWAFGKKVKFKISRKRKMSLAKIGEKHPKFKGWYMIRGKKYASSYIASKKIGIERSSVIRWSRARKNNWSFKKVCGCSAG